MKSRNLKQTVIEVPGNVILCALASRIIGVLL